MHLIGYWIRSVHDEEFCAPQEVVGRLDAGVRRRVADYLDTGGLHTQYLGYSWCRCFCDVPEEKMGTKDLSDGSWVWPEGLSHYVRKHGITLPDQFVRHVLARKSSTITRPFQDAGFFELVEQSSLDLWRAWCASRRSPILLKRLRRARADADKRAQKADKRAQKNIKRLIAEKVAEQGLSNRRCIWAGCKEKSLAGARVCARHSLSEIELIMRGHYSITPELLDHCR